MRGLISPKMTYSEMYLELLKKNYPEYCNVILITIHYRMILFPPNQKHNNFNAEPIA